MADGIDGLAKEIVRFLVDFSKRNVPFLRKALPV